MPPCSQCDKDNHNKSECPTEFLSQQLRDFAEYKTTLSHLSPEEFVRTKGLDKVSIIAKGEEYSYTDMASDDYTRLMLLADKIKRRP